MSEKKNPVSLLGYPPPGFHAAVEKLSGLSESKLKNICGQVLKHLLNGENLPAEEDGDVKDIITALSHIYRQCIASCVPVKTLSSQLKKHTTISQQALTVVCQVWIELVPDPEKVLRPVFHIGKLSDLQWKLGVTLSSKSCLRLASPFITVSMKVTREDGSVTTHVIDMSVEELNEFISHFRRIHESLLAV